MQSSRAATMTAVLADDEQLAREELSYLLRDVPDVEVVGAVTNGLEAVEAVEQLDPDLLFLDVQMPGLDGMEVIRRLRENETRLPYFVLATAYDQYAVEAFHLEALDYLLKPVDKERLEQTLARARKWIAERPAPQPEATAPPKPVLQRSKLLVKHGGRNFIVDAGDIIYATIEDGLITVVTTTMDGVSNYRTIEELQSNLDPEMFWRVHRSYLVNVNRIREVVPWFKSSYQLRMDDRKQSEIPVSRVQTRRLRAMLKL